MFGSALAVGNFDGDRYDDLAIGVPKEDYFGADAGIAHLLWGDAGGITTINDLLLQQELISGESHEVNDRFGWALAAADF